MKTFMHTLKSPRISNTLACALILVLLALPFMVSTADLQLVALVAIAGLFAQSINVLTGYLGKVSLGHAAIYGAGAYGSSVLALKFGLSPLLSMPIGVGVAMLFGLILSVPAGRVKDLYLAMVTLGFGLVALQVFREWTSVTNGFSGLSRIPSAALGNFSLGGLKLGIVGYFYFVIIAVVLIIASLRLVLRSHIGRSFMAIHESEVAARTMGISVEARTRMAYLLSAALAGTAGVLYSHLLGFVSPSTFDVNASIAVLVFAILGGMRSIVGPFVGAALITIVMDRLSFINEYQHLIYGLILLLVFIVLPKGLAAAWNGRTPLTITHAQNSTADHNSSQTPRPIPALDRPVLKMNGIELSFGGIRALDGVNFEVAPRTIHGLIGPNGSGKSTLLNVVSGIYEPQAGTVLFQDEEFTKVDPVRAARSGLGRTFQHPQLNGELTVLENVLLGASAQFDSNIAPTLLGLPSWRRQEQAQLQHAYAVLERVGIAELAEEKAQDLPFGRQRMVELARVLCADPSIIMLDEPAAGLAENDLVDLAALLAELRTEGITIVIIEHHLDFLWKLVDEVTVLTRGRVLCRGSPADVTSDPAVVEAYLGSHERTPNA